MQGRTISYFPKRFLQINWITFSSNTRDQVSSTWLQNRDWLGRNSQGSGGGEITQFGFRETSSIYQVRGWLFNFQTWYLIKCVLYCSYYLKCKNAICGAGWLRMSLNHSSDLFEGLQRLFGVNRPFIWNLPYFPGKLFHCICLLL